MGGQRARGIQKKFWVTPREDREIRKRMMVAGIANFGLYARYMLVTGQVRLIDFAALKQLRLEIRRIGVNVNQIAKLANENSQVSREMLVDLMAKQEELEQMVSRLIKQEVGQFEEEEGSDGRDQGLSD